MWWRSTESGAWRFRPICETMFMAISAVRPWPEGGISSTSWPMKSVEIGFTQVDSCAAKSSMVRSEPLARTVAMMSSAMAPR